MADENTSALVNRARIQKGKLTLSDFGPGALVKTVTPDKKPNGFFYMGTIIGRVVDVLARANPKAGSENQPDTFEGLKGNFLFQPSNTEMDEMESGVLFIPDAFHNLLSDQLRVEQKKDASATIEFAMDVFTVEAKNPAGYSWVMKPAFPPEGKHPLENIAAKVAAARKALPAPDKQVEDKRTASRR
jgi:hypothetical protein